MTDKASLVGGLVKRFGEITDLDGINFEVPDTIFADIFAVADAAGTDLLSQIPREGRRGPAPVLS